LLTWINVPVNSDGPGGSAPALALAAGKFSPELAIHLWT
jgi:hypothetical protein